MKLSNGYWYIETKYHPGWAIVSVLEEQLDPKNFGNFNVWLTDEEGSFPSSEFTFLGKVPDFYAS